MDVLDISLILSIISCSLVGGFILHMQLWLCQAYQTLMIKTF